MAQICKGGVPAAMHPAQACRQAGVEELRACASAVSAAGLRAVQQRWEVLLMHSTTAVTLEETLV